MALLDGKQLRNDSTGLGKLSGSGIVSFTAATMSFTSGSVLTTATANIVNPTDVVNKEYVDSVAAGLDPKQSVAYTTTGNISLGYLTTQTNGDWSGTLTDGDRILVKNQTDKTENGIYVAADGDWNRAEDHDGTPANEVTLGNFTFVEYGTLAGSGYVLHSTNSTNSPIITPGTDEQEWTLYSQAGAYTAGTGLNLTDGEFEIDVTGVGAGSYGSADSTTTFTVNSEGQLTAAADTQISIVASQVTDFDLAAETAIFEDPNFVDGTTIEFDVTAGDSVTAEVSDSSLTSAKLDTGSNGGATAGYVLSVDNNGDFKWKLDEGDISSIDAGNGLIGGGTAGDIQLNLGGTVNDDITFDFGGTGSINFGLNPFQNSETFSIGTKNFQAFAFNDLGLPACSLHMNNGISTLSADLMDGTATLMGNTVSLSGSKDVGIVAATGKLDMSSPEINLGGGQYTNDINIKGDYTTIEGKTLDVTTNFVSIDSGTGPSQFVSGTDTTISASSSLNLTADEGNVTTGDGKGLQYTADYSSTFVDNSLVTKKYVDSLDAAQITGVEAGNGLLGGGTAGDVTLNLGGTVSSTIVFNFTQSSHIEFKDQQAFITDSAQYARTRVPSGNLMSPGYNGNGSNDIYVTPTQVGIKGDAIEFESNSVFNLTSATFSVNASGNVLTLGTTSNTFTDGANGKGIEYAADYSANFTDNSLVTKKYVDSLDADQITGVDAGAGLSGGGTAGTVALSVNTSNGLSVDGDNVVLGGTLSQATTIAGGNQELFLGLSSSQITFLHIDAIQAQERYSSPGADVVTIDKNPGGFKLKNTDTAGVSTMEANFNNGDIDMHATDAQGNASDFSISNNSIQAISNQGNGQLTLVGGQTQIVGQETIDIQGGTLSVGTNVINISTGDFKVDVGTGIEYTSDISANFTDRSLVDKAYADTKVSGVTAGAGLSGGGADGDITLNADLTVDGGLTFSSTGDAGTIEVVVDNSTIQVVNGALSVVAGTSQPVYQSATSSVATGNTGIALTSTPNDYSRVEVYVNGQLQDLTENTTGDCYFGQAGTILSSLTSGDSLFWNSANAGFELSATDVVKVHYQA